MFKGGLNTSRDQNQDAQHLKKYKVRITKEIEDIKQKELDQVVSSLNSSLIIKFNLNFILETERRKRQTSERDQRQNQTIRGHHCRGDQVQSSTCREKQNIRIRYLLCVFRKLDLMNLYFCYLQNKNFGKSLPQLVFNKTFWNPFW